jgi:predicted sugar kinase
VEEQAMNEQRRSTTEALWQHMHQEHGLILMESQLDEIIRLATCEALINLMEQRGFVVGRGTYAHPNGETLPTWVVTRPTAPDWSGVWSPWDERPDHIEDGEAQVLLEVCRLAISKWDEEAHLFVQENEPK